MIFNAQYPLRYSFKAEIETFCFNLQFVHALGLLYVERQMLLGVEIDNFSW